MIYIKSGLKNKKIIEHMITLLHCILECSAIDGTRIIVKKKFLIQRIKEPT